MASKKEIVEQLSKMAVVFNRQLTAEEFRLLVIVWADIFAEIRDETLGTVCFNYMKESKKFPAPAEIYQGCFYLQQEQETRELAQ